MVWSQHEDELEMSDIKDATSLWKVPVNKALVRCFLLILGYKLRFGGVRKIIHAFATVAESDWGSILAFMEVVSAIL